MEKHKNVHRNQRWGLAESDLGKLPACSFISTYPDKSVEETFVSSPKNVGNFRLILTKGQRPVSRCTNILPSKSLHLINKLFDK